MKNYIKEHKKAYLILAANRGPDYDQDVNILYLDCLKALITARIRSICFFKEEVHGLWNDKPLDKFLFNKILKHLCLVKRSAGTHHYISHLEEAVRHTDDHPVWGGFGLDLSNMLRNYLKSNT